MPDEIRSSANGYRKGQISRREFIQKAAVLTGGLAAVTNFIDVSLSPDADAAQVDPNDPALISSEVKFSAPDSVVISGYLSRPKEKEKRPAVVVVHEWRGINDHIRDVARKLAKAGYVALVPDLLSRHGGTASFPSPQAATDALLKIDEGTITGDLAATLNYLKRQNFVRADKIGVIGFCWGGGKALAFATRNSSLGAAVVYYGENPHNLEDVKNITAPVLGQYGEADKRITSGVPKLEAAMKKYGKSFTYNIYPGAPHAFNNDTNPRSYREAAAQQAWASTLEFLKKHLQN